MNSTILPGPGNAGTTPSNVIDLASHRRRRATESQDADAFHAEIASLSAFVWSEIRAAAGENVVPPLAPLGQPVFSEGTETAEIAEVIDLAARRSEREMRKSVEAQLRETAGLTALESC